MKSTYSLFIGGEWKESVSKRWMNVIDPATEEVIAQVPDAVAEDIALAVNAAEKVQPEWGNTVASERSKILLEAAHLMRQRIDKLAKILTSEEGKPLAEARGEIAYAASFLEWFSEEAKRIYGDLVPSSSASKRILVIKRPVGISAAITPWNFPAAMITRKLGPALAAGCTMIVKPSELTPLTALEMASIFEEAGLPKGVLSVVVGSDASQLGEAIMSDFRVRKISFTGSTEVGKILMRQAADTMKRISLELGGHAPFIVFPDADLDAAVENAVLCKMRGMGETCVSANRFYVHQDILEQFVKKMVEKMSQMKVGNGLQEGISVGPLIEPAAVEKVERHVQNAVQKGARLWLGGKPLENTTGYFYPPTVLSEVKEDMLIMQEETFGPVAAITSFATEEEVIARANDSRYGLAAYFFTRDVGRLFRMAEQLEYGIMGANDGMPSTAQAPFGGVKESGLGREGSKYGIEEYLDIKYLSVGL
ncbi:NAD-dependent succinate-semialdehyde dehydrogenase [Alicyclobacillus tolerans]|uniref:Succinate semialdehyde dehydrogenase n=2 Tax=Alicyclobacillus tolerans TaxID=90970 RepID=A0A1M6NKF2_9BACL|nr:MULTISPECIES: NAD-dependent succinate-semialdehyde dehydrogenase [Alicyclobacillus]MDP9727465.1 succinate-semialdehyde dehydrogenase/glutarate-semialdehyde dehydrogenase [Alicyclobacillus tengchongensis]QRF23916.1 NAD-dependent succinate-semialdehyde dehydrogenase [Alicyclobacillus sp. TC]SHJ96169.1 succinate semialdehyde dehydrogenase [Alicyclobacillus montanus]